MTRRNVLIAILVTAALGVASVARIHNLDYFWHLATGRWIVEHHQLPRVDPFAVASAKTPWVDGEWLFQIPLYLLYAAGGHRAVSIAVGIAIGVLFGIIFFVLMEDDGRPGLASSLFVTLVCWYGAWEWLRERPAALGAALLVTLLLALERERPLILVALITIIWINVHPSALIAPVVCALWVAGTRRGFLAPLVAAAALFVNPYGIHGILAPLQLARVISLFHNIEWQPSTFAEFPRFYIVAAAAAFLLVRKRDLARTLVFVFLTALAVRYSRNQGLFWPSVPVLIAGALPPVAKRVDRVLLAATILAFCGVLAGAQFAADVDERSLPAASVARIRSAGLRGNIYSSYGYGGFLIWSFYPERRVVTDGRNELYVDYEREHQAALQSGDRWRALIARYDIRLAVFPRRKQTTLQVGTRQVPATLAYFPPSRWAFVAADPAAVVFVRRDAFPPETLRPLELPRKDF